MTRKGSLLIATPAYGRIISMEYFNGILSTISTNIEGWERTVKLIGNESLVQRARQYFAKYAMEKKFDKLLFIDADIGFTGEDVKRLVLHDKLVVGGTYPLKQIPPILNFNTLPDHDISDIPNHRSLDGLKKLNAKYGVGGGLLEVRHVPTGFLCIDVEVFRRLENFVPGYSGRAYSKAQEFEKIPEFFPVRVRDGILESEDWAFCTLCRDHGIKVYLDTEVVVSHTANVIIDVHHELGVRCGGK